MYCRAQIERLSWCVLEIHSVTFNYERTIMDLRMNIANVFTNNSHKKELQRAEEEESNHDWRNAQAELVPKRDLVHEIYKARKKRKQRSGEAGKSHQSERYFG